MTMTMTQPTTNQIRSATPGARRLLCALLLLIAAFSLATPLLADDECKEPCGDHCGDCAWCPLTAELLSIDPSVCMKSVHVFDRPDRESWPVFARVPDHVPLPV